jgi:5-methylcytosine-specific restriction endonuclease McrA
MLRAAIHSSRARAQKLQDKRARVASSSRTAAGRPMKPTSCPKCDYAFGGPHDCDRILRIRAENAANAPELSSRERQHEVETQRNGEPEPYVPPFKPFKDGKGYAPATQLRTGRCAWCGGEFTGAMDKCYCSANCRLTAWRARKHEQNETGHKPRHLLGWAQKRFAVLERDGFKCVYCGRGPNDGVVLHVDHVEPRWIGGPARLENLVTACAECNMGKGPHQLAGTDIASLARMRLSINLPST